MQFINSNGIIKFWRTTRPRQRVGLLIFVILLTGLLFSGCQPAAAPEPAEPEAPDPSLHPEKSAALLINRPTEEERQQYHPVGNLMLQESQEGFIFVAIREDTDLEVMEIEMQEDGNLIELGPVYQVVDAPAGFALEITAIRPEGAPSYKLLIQIGDQQQVEYYISYNGKDGNPKEEYVFEK